MVKSDKKRASRGNNQVKRWTTVPHSFSRWADITGPGPLDENKYAALAKAFGDREVLLHIGMTKAGSTALQNNLEEQYEALVEQGILFPRSVFSRKDKKDQARTSGHLDMLQALRQDSDLDALSDEIGSNDPHLIILSAENFFHNTNQLDLELLKAAFAKANLRVLAILRHQADWIRSRYLESVTKGFYRETRNFSKYVHSQITDNTLNYAARLNLFDKVLAPDKITVWDYGQSLKADGLIARFHALAGIEGLSTASKSDKGNVSKPIAELIDAMRLLNGAAVVLTPPTYRQWCADMRTLAEEINKKKTLTAGYPPLAHDACEALRAHTRDVNGKLSVYGTGLDEGDYFTKLADTSSIDIDRRDMLISMGASLLESSAKLEKGIDLSTYEQNTKLRNANKKLSELGKTNTKLKSEQAQLKAEHTKLKAERTKLKAERTKLKRTIASMRNSLSWRVTAPLRAARRFMKSVRK